MKNFLGEVLISDFTKEELIEQLNEAKKQLFEYLILPSKNEFKLKGLAASRFLTKEEYLSLRRREWEEYGRDYEGRNFDKWVRETNPSLYVSIDALIKNDLQTE